MAKAMKKLRVPIKSGRAPIVSGREQVYYLASRRNQTKDTIIKVGGVTFGGNNFVIIAGPCAVESQKQIIQTARWLKIQGAQMLRGGIFKPRTSPYSFQGLGLEGLEYLYQAKVKFGLPIVTEVLTPAQVYELLPKVDLLQVGARNMQNFALLDEIGRVDKPVLLKRGIMASIDELLAAAEYILARGNRQVILCERGIRTFESATRNTLDLSAVPVLKEKTHLPVIVDPSHATGCRRWVIPMAKAAMACGAHGVMVEVHPAPERALSDGDQSLGFTEFRQLVKELNKLRPACC
ncbi:MAG: 3-deoxy-7-phosphoheptulonate synthase [Planctomycetota bacterium]